MAEYLVIALGSEENETAKEIVIVEAETHQDAMAAAIIGFFGPKFGLRERINGTSGDDDLAERFLTSELGSGRETASAEEFAAAARAFFAPFPEFAELYVADVLAHLNEQSNELEPLEVPEAVLVHTWVNDLGIPLLVFDLAHVPRIAKPS